MATPQQQQQNPYGNQENPWANQPQQQPHQPQQGQQPAQGANPWANANWQTISNQAAQSGASEDWARFTNPGGEYNKEGQGTKIMDDWWKQYGDPTASQRAGRASVRMKMVKERNPAGNAETLSTKTRSVS